MGLRQITTRFLAFKVTTPAGTSSSSPQRTTLEVPDTVLRNVELRIPNGHVGVTGFALDYGGTRILPWGDSSPFMVGDDEDHDYRFRFNISSGLVAVTYNTGVYQHSHYLRLEVDDLPAASSSSSPARPFRLVAPVDDVA